MSVGTTGTRSVTGGCIDASLVARILDGDPAAMAAWEQLMHSGGELEIACERTLPATYDAHYVALAGRFRVPLWTCDRRLAKELVGGSPEVHLVS